MSKKETRADRFMQAQASVLDGKEQIETLRDELQEWRDNMPENLQASAKAEELDETIDELDGLIEQLDEVATTDVNFPGAR